MDKWLENFARLSREKYPQANPQAPGAGAAGGLGFALLAYTKALLEPGIEIVLQETKLEEHIKKAALVITGEGRLDGQTVMGKAPIGVANLAQKQGKPVIALAGCIGPEAGLCNEHGIAAFFPVLRQVVTLAEALEKDTARRNLTDTAEQVMRLVKAMA